METFVITLFLVFVGAGLPIAALATDASTNTPAANLIAPPQGGGLFLRLKKGLKDSASTTTNLDVLCRAIDTRDPMPEVRRIVEEGSLNLNARSTNLGSPLYAAAFHGHLDVVRYLVEKGADPNYEGTLKRNASFPIAVAARHDRRDIARFLLESGADVNRMGDDESNAVSEAARHLHPEMLALLFEHGGAVVTNTIRPAYQDAMWSWTEPLQPGEKQDRYLACLRLLVEHGLPVNEPDGPRAMRHTPLTWCVFRDCPSGVEYLLSIGADPGIFLPDWPASKDHRGSAFAIARHFARTNCLEILERHQP